MYILVMVLLIISYLKDKKKTRIWLAWNVDWWKYRSYGAWSTTKIPMLLFEASAMGWKFMLTRFLIDIPGIAVIAYTTERILTKNEKSIIYYKG